MRGVFFTAITFLIFSVMLLYVSIKVYDNIEKSKTLAEKISAQRIFYAWKDVDGDICNALNVSLSKKEDILEINDSLPAIEDISGFLNLYQGFVSQVYRDPTMNVDFEDASGNKVNLRDMNPQMLFKIKPMNVVYSYPSYGKNELKLEVNPSNFSFINDIKLFIKLKNVYFDCNTTHPSSPNYCEKWSPDKSVPSCTGVQFCLNLNLSFQDAANTVFYFQKTHFDVNQKSTANLNVKNVTGSFFITIDAGSLPLILNVNLHNVQVDTFMDVRFNTSNFYMNLPSILNVTTPFGRKVDDL